MNTFRYAKIEILKNDEIVELKYFEDLNDIRYRSWKIPIHIIEELEEWWPKLRKYPLKITNKRCEFSMVTSKWLYIREISETGFYEIIGWDILSILIDNLLKILQDNIFEKIIKFPL